MCLFTDQQEAIPAIKKQQNVANGIHEHWEELIFVDDLVAMDSASECRCYYDNRSIILFSPCNHLRICLRCKAGYDTTNDNRCLRVVRFHARLPPRDSFQDVLALGSSGICINCNYYHPKFIFRSCNHLCLCKRCKANFDLEHADQEQDDFQSHCPQCNEQYVVAEEVYYL